MSTAEILELVSLISFIVAGVCLVLAAFFWFFFKIPTVIGDLSGRTAKKSIEKMRQANMQSGNKSYRSSVTNAARGKITDTMEHPTAAPRHVAPPASAGRPETGLLEENKTSALHSAETVALDSVEATGLLVDEGATTALNVPAEPAMRSGGKKLTMINEIMLIHTDEVI